jgi:hypothetical protein
MLRGVRRRPYAIEMQLVVVSGSPNGHSLHLSAGASACSSTI